MKLPVDDTIKCMLNNRLGILENHFEADVLSFYGPILEGSESMFLRIVRSWRTNLINILHYI